MKNVLITGINGFIGSSMVEALKPETGYFKIWKGDRDGSCPLHMDRIYDFASYGNMYDQTEPNEIYQANCIRLLQLLQNTNSYDYEAFIVTGSSSEYGKHNVPLHEDLLPRPENLYAASKVAATELAQTWAKMYNKPIVVIRPFSVTGIGEQPKHLIPTLIRSCLKQELMQFDPEPVHDFVDIRDFTDAVRRISVRAGDLKGSIINIGTGTQYSNQEVREMVEKITKKKAKITEFRGLRPYDSKMWVADNTRLKSLGWKQEHKLYDTIRSMIEKFKHERYER